jgi:hypothetical protein
MGQPPEILLVEDDANDVELTLMALAENQSDEVVVAQTLRSNIAKKGQCI